MDHSFPNDFLLSMTCESLACNNRVAKHQMAVEEGLQTGKSIDLICRELNLANCCRNTIKYNTMSLDTYRNQIPANISVGEMSSNGIGIWYEGCSMLQPNDHIIKYKMAVEEGLQTGKSLEVVCRELAQTNRFGTTCPGSTEMSSNDLSRWYERLVSQAKEAEAPPRHTRVYQTHTMEFLGYRTKSGKLTRHIAEADAEVQWDAEHIEPAKRLKAHHIQMLQELPSQ